jgi:hypothetical protein
MVFEYLILIHGVVFKNNVSDLKLNRNGARNFYLSNLDLKIIYAKVNQRKISGEQVGNNITSRLVFPVCNRS